MTSQTQTLVQESKKSEHTQYQLGLQTELDLSRVEDLALFLESAEDVYADAATFKKIAQAEAYSSLSFDDVQGEEIFNTLFSVLQELQQHILAAEEQVVVKKQSVTDAQVASMQCSYDNMILLRNLVRDTYANSGAISVPKTLRSEDTDTGDTKSATEFTATPIEQKVNGAANDVVMVCGMPIPEAGAAGMTAARALRESLLMQRDRHYELVSDPKKQLAADKLIRVLSSLSPSGLSFTETAEVRALALSIAVTQPMSELPRENFKSGIPESLRPTTAIESRGEDERDLYNTSTSKVMEIAADNVERTIKIAVAENTKARMIEHVEAPLVTPLVTINPHEQDRSVLSEIERRDVIQTAVPKQTHHILPAKRALAAESLTAQYLFDPAYQAFIAANYTSPGAFERMLDITITEIESRTVDIFERWLKEEQTSPFLQLSPLTVAEVLLISQSRDCRENLLAEKIKYETFVAWVDLIPQMQAVVGNDEHMKFGELFARYMIESEMFYQAPVATT